MKQWSNNISRAKEEKNQSTIEVSVICARACTPFKANKRCKQMEKGRIKTNMKTGRSRKKTEEDLSREYQQKLVKCNDKEKIVDKK